MFSPYSFNYSYFFRRGKKLLLINLFFIWKLRVYLQWICRQLVCFSHFWNKFGTWLSQACPVDNSLFFLILPERNTHQVTVWLGTRLMLCGKRRFYRYLIDKLLRSVSWETFFRSDSRNAVYFLRNSGLRWANDERRSAAQKYQVHYPNTRVLLKRSRLWWSSPVQTWNMTVLGTRRNTAFLLNTTFNGHWTSIYNLLTSERDYNTFDFEIQRRQQGHVTYKSNLLR